MPTPLPYTPEMGDKICFEIMSTNKSLRTICRMEEMPCMTTMLKWLRENEEFALQYARAKQEQADYFVEEMLDIADDSKNDNETRYTAEGEPYIVENKEWVNRSKLRVDTRKWIASKLKPKKYGEKLDITSGGEKVKTVLTGVQPPLDEGDRIS